MSSFLALAPDFSTSAVLAQTVGAIAVVVLFLRHLKEERDSREKIDVARHAALENLGKDCHTHSQMMMEAANKTAANSNAVIQESSKVMGRIAFHLENEGVE
jgi:hypothetical protein